MRRKDLLRPGEDENGHKLWPGKILRYREARAVCRRPWLFLLFSALSLGLLSLVCQHAFSRNEVDKVARWRRIDINDLKSSRFESYYADRANNEAVPRMDQVLHVFFHQCANPFYNKWEWGQYVWRIISSSLPPASLTWAAGDPPGRSNATQKPILYCFKSCFFDHNYGIWIQKGDIQQWQKALDPFSPEVQISQSERCCRIGIFQRKTGQSLRSFTNLNDLRLLAQKYSPYPIEIVSIDESEPVSKQIMIFNSFDILMSPHGSHLANLLFISRKITLIEIISCAADEVFKENGELLGVDYILSTGHGTGASCPEAAKRSYLQAVSHHRGNGEILRCDISTKNCDVHVNLSIIESILASKTTPELKVIRRRM
eukprot:jgi/Picre1/32764/NNA_001050.t1